MKAQLFVRTPTNYCDYDQVLKPAFVTEINYLLIRIQRSYDNFSLQKKSRFMYVAVNQEGYTLAGAWLNVAALVKEGLISEQYQKRIRNNRMQEQYYAFVGFVIEKEAAKDITLSITEHDFVCVFNDIIEKIWDRSADEDYPVQEASFEIDTRYGTNDADVRNYVTAVRRNYISSKEPTLNVFNSIINAMLHENSPPKLSFCSGLKNRKNFDEQITFELGCDYKEVASKKKILSPKKIEFHGCTPKNAEPLFYAENFPKATEFSHVPQITRTTISLGMESTATPPVPTILTPENAQPNAPLQEAQPVQNVPVLSCNALSETNRAPVITTIEVQRITPPHVPIFGPKPKKTSSHAKEARPKRKKKNVWTLLKQFGKFITTDIRDLRKGTEDDD